MHSLGVLFMPIMLHNYISFFGRAQEMSLTISWPVLVVLIIKVVQGLYEFRSSKDVYYILLSYNYLLPYAIITRGLNMFYPILKDHFFVFKEFFSENSVLMYG